MTTIKIKPTHPSQGEFVVIEKVDFDPSKHELLEGDSLGDVAGGSEGAPTLADLRAAATELQLRKDQLDDLQLQLSQHSDALQEREQRLADQAAANEVEAKRLRDEAARLQAARDAAVATAPVTAAASTSTEKPAKAAKA